MTSALHPPDSDELQGRSEGKTVLVTGAAGKLGSQLCAALLARKHHVVALDRRLGDTTAHNLAFHQADLLDLDAILPVFANVELVIHAAALHGIHLSQFSDDTFFTNNVLGLFNVIQACMRQNVPKLVFTSSTAVYGEAADPVDGKAIWVTEETPRRGRRGNIYNTTKIVGEDLCQHAALAYGLDVTVLRCTRYTDDFPEDHMRKLGQGVDLRDAVEAHCLAAETTPEGGYQAYNIGPKLPFQQSDMADLCANAAVVIERYFPGAASILRRLAVELPQSIGRVYDIAKAERELGYRPRHNFIDFLASVQPDQAG